MKSRLIAHIDMDCFYVQVERSFDKTLNGIPAGVVQYNPFGDLKSIKFNENRKGNTNGSLIAVSYEARAAGVKRNMRGGEALKLCPNIQLVTVPTAHGKADLTIYRDAGARVVELLSKRVKCTLEKASIDEV